MNRLIALIICFLTNSFSFIARADDCVPPPGGICLPESDKKKILDSLNELKTIKDAPAEVQIIDPIRIITDWDGRTYIPKSITMKLKLGTIDRDLVVDLPAQVYYRPQPPDPMFRLRIRAQIGVLVPEAIQSLTGNKQSVVSGGVSWDVFHISFANLAAYTGIDSCGIVVGFDLTKNAGIAFGPVFVYSGIKTSGTAGLYFAFN